MNSRTLPIAFPIALLSLLLLAACYTVPETGRTAFNVVPESTMASMSASAFDDMKSKQKVVRDPAVQARVRRIGMRILEVVPQQAHLPPPNQWEFVVFEDPSINAFAMSGGKVGVNSGLLDAARSDDEVAMVIGHEIAHVVARHGTERFSQQMAAGVGGLGLGLATRDMGRGEQAAVMAAYGAGASMGVLLPYSRRHELEADRLGLFYAARAGYDPRAAIQFWERIGSEGGPRAAAFLSTHPTNQARIQQFEELMPAAMADYRRARG